MEQKLINLNEHIEICDHCNCDYASCECHTNNTHLNDAKRNYENSHNLWILQMASWHDLNWFKRLIIPKPVEPRIEDFI